MRRRLLLKGLGPLAALMGMLFSAPADAQQSVPIESARQLRPILQRRIPDAGRRGSLAFARTELYFGTAKSDGTVVTEEEFRAFIDQVITPRFPDGLTVLKGDGQFRLDDDTVIKEQSFVVILLYSSETQKESSRRIEVIRQLYLNLHDQESVLRVDDPFFVWVSFPSRATREPAASTDSSWIQRRRIARSLRDAVRRAA